MNYNIYYKGHFVTTNLFDLSDAKLDKIIAAYKSGNESFTLAGKEYAFSSVSEFRIFMNESDWDAERIESFLTENKLYSSGIGAWYVSPKVLRRLGGEITEEKIGDLAYGSEKKSTDEKSLPEAYVDANRIQELKEIFSNEFDLSKLIRLCEELNSNWEHENFFTVGLIIRTIINHVPPIFGAFTSFEQVVAGYGGISIKKNMKSLNESLRSVADSYTHQTIRKREPLSNSNQIDFRSNLDFLLSEIIVILHK